VALGCQTSLTSSDLGACVKQDRAELLETARLAIEAGFGVSFLPILITDNWEWRGFFEPRDVDAWFRAFDTWVGELAAQSEELGAPELVVATEMNRLYRHVDQWRRTLALARSRFSGPVVITANWDDLNHDILAEADALGVSAYFPLASSDDPSQEELDRAWGALKGRLLSAADRIQLPLHITEVGYQSARGAARTPWSAPADAAVDFDLQARCYEAFRRAWRGESRLARVSFWATGGEPDSPGLERSFEPLGKPAEGVAAAFFGGTL